MAVWDKKTKIRLQNLLENKEYSDLILNFRKEIGIPATGLKSLDEVEEFMGAKGVIGKKRNRIYEKLATKIYDNYKLDSTLAEAFMDYALQGYNSGLYTLFKFHKVELVPPNNTDKEKFISIKIYPGAIKKDVINFIKGEWELIDAFLISVGGMPHIYETMKRVKEKTKQNRNEQIYELYKLGVINYHGLFNDRKAEQYLSIIEDSNNFESKGLNLRQRFKQIGLNLPGQPGIKKVIFQMRKLKN